MTDETIACDPAPRDDAARRDATWRAVCVTALVAAIVPIVWSGFVEFPSHPALTVAMVVTSVTFWALVAKWLARIDSSANALLTALVIGATSPLLCSTLMFVLLAPFVLFLLLTGPIAGWLPALPFYAPLVIVFCWPLFIPVGAGMGLCAFAIRQAIGLRGAGRPHVDHGLRTP